MEIDKDLLEQIKNKTNYADIEVIRRQLSFKIGRPSNTTYFKVHPSWTYVAAVLEIEGGNEIYILKETLVPELASLIKIKIFFPYLTRDGLVGFWPIVQPGAGRMHTATQSALLAIETAKNEWVRVAYNKKNSSYEMLYPQEPILGVDWPDRKIEDIAGSAFNDFFIKNMDHPVIKKIQGRT